MGQITEHYGELTFNHQTIKSYLKPTIFKQFMNTLQNGAKLNPAIANDIAAAAKEWAISNGATHFSHWFQPQRGGTAEKHDGFINYAKDGQIMESFSASQLIQSEPDASSFPSGGIRSTFEARGYTAWDPASPMYLRDTHNGRSLIIPSIYLSWTGEALDMKTPLHRSIAALNSIAIDLQRELGNKKAKRITVFSGLEQEYFLIPIDVAETRPDLMICNRTIFGCPPCKGQLMEDHYFGSISPQVMEFMNDLDNELYRYGIPAKTKHNEVAPNQFELAPMYEEIGLAIDHNLQIMDVMRQVAQEHGFLVLHHEKPFAGLNGSGKHMNWSIGDNTGTNYLEPSNSPMKNMSFLLTLSAILYGAQHYAGLLQSTISDAGNEHRLGSHEAPPAILSIYLGDHLRDILEHIEKAKTFTNKTLGVINHGLENMPNVTKDISDRNRTSPIAFTGSKFELRALGGSANGSDSAKVLNLICCSGYQYILDQINKKNDTSEKHLLNIIKDILKKTKAIRFEGNNYSDEWKKEAKKRGLFMIDTTPDAIQFQTDPKNIKLFEQFNVLSKREVLSRVDIKLEAFSNTKLVEFKLALNLTRQHILPAVLDQLADLSDTLQSLKSNGITNASIKEDTKSLNDFYTQIQRAKKDLRAFVNSLDNITDPYKRAKSIAKKGASLLQTLRHAVDNAERRVGYDYWQLASYDELLLTT